MKTTTKLILILGLLMSITTFAKERKGGGREVGDGGDLVSCTKSTSNKLAGDYSLDYVMTYNPMNHNEDIVKVKNWRESKKRILNRLKDLSPSYYKSFKSFVRDMHVTYNIMAKRSWKFVANKPIELNDESLYETPYKNCLRKDGKVNKRQFVLRTTPSKGRTIYRVNLDLYRKIKKERPLQFSFTMVHEWLWDYSGDVELTRETNRLIHSITFKTITKDQFEVLTKRLRDSKSKPVVATKDVTKLSKKLYTEVARDNYSVAKHLLQIGANPNLAVNKNTGTNAVMASCQNGNIRMLKLLIKHGALLDARNTKGQNALYYALGTKGNKNKLAITRLLIANGLNVNEKRKDLDQLVFMVAENGFLDSLATLKEVGADLNTVNEKGETPLICAINNLQASIVKQLISFKVDLNIGDNYGNTALHFALKMTTKTMAMLDDHKSTYSYVNKKLENASYWLNGQCENNTNLDCTSMREEYNELYDRAESLKFKMDQLKLLLKAIIKAQRAIIPALVNAGASVDIKNLKKETPFSLLFYLGLSPYSNVFMHKMLLKVIDNSSNLELYRNDGKTPLILATNLYGDFGIPLVKALLRVAPLSVHLKDQKGLTPIFYANKFLMPLLIKAGAKVNVQDKKGKTPIFYANKNTAPLLIKSGAKVNVQDKEGKTPIFYTKSFEATKLLIDANANPNILDKKGVSALKYNLINYFTADARFNSNYASTYKQKHLAAINALIKNGANLNRLDSKGTTMIQLMNMHKQIDHTDDSKYKLLKVACEHGANINVAVDSTTGDSLLLIAVKEMDLKRITAFMKIGADPRFKDNKGHDSFWWTGRYKAGKRWSWGKRFKKRKILRNMKRILSNK